MQDFLLTHYAWLKSAHLVFVIAWMAGLMYLPRLFIYHFQASAKGEAEGFFLIMERRLLKGIMTPSMVVVWLLALTMIFANPAIASQGWFAVKLVAVIGISAVHMIYASAQKKFAGGERPRTEKFWRIANEVPFVLMIIAIIMVIVRPFA